MNIREKAEYSRQSYQNHRLTLWFRRNELGVVCVVLAVVIAMNVIGDL